MAFPRTTGAAPPRRVRSDPAPGPLAGPLEFAGRARLGRRTKRLVTRLSAGDVAVVDHRDLDRISAEDLVASGVRCVLNAQESSSGSYPNQGPLVLARAGVHLVDFPGAQLFELISDGEHIRVRGDELYASGELVARGRVWDLASVERAHELGRERIGEALEAFADNTMRHIKQERELLGGRLELPDFETVFRDRPALVVVRGVDHQQDLRILRPYVRD